MSITGIRLTVFNSLRSLSNAQELSVMSKSNKQIKFIDANNNYWYDADTIADKSGLNPDVVRSFLESMSRNHEVDVMYFRNTFSSEHGSHIKCYHVNKYVDTQVRTTELSDVVDYSKNM